MPRAVHSELSSERITGLARFGAGWDTTLPGASVADRVKECRAQLKANPAWFKPCEKYDGRVTGLRLRVMAPERAVWRWGGMIKGRLAPPQKIGPAFRADWTPGTIEETHKAARTKAAEYLHAFEVDHKTPQDIEAERKRAKEAVERAQRMEDEKRPPILRDYVESLYADHVRHTNKDAEATISRLSKCFLDWEVPARVREDHPLRLGDWPITAITQPVAEEWKLAALKAGKSKATVKRDLGALRAALSPNQCAAVEKWLTDAPFKVRKLKVNPENPRYLLRGEKGEDNEKERLWAAMEERERKLREGRARNNERRIAKGSPPYPPLEGEFFDEVRPLILFLIYTGLRIGEASALQWRDVDLAGGTVTVRASNTKTETTRTVPLNDFILGVLKAWRKQTREIGHVFYQVHGKHKGKPIGETKTFWARLLRLAKIENLRIHDLRHTFASWLVQEGEDLYVVKDLLGHSTIKITERYAHLGPRKGRAAVAKLTA